MPHVRYQVQVFNRGVVSTTGTVAFTIGSSRLADAPVIGGQTIRPVEGRTESEPWVFSVLDVGSTFTAQLANASGRAHLLGRLARVRMAHDSTSYASVAVGRMTDIALDPNVAAYHVTIGDERWLERQSDIFTKANTAMLVPAGLINGFAQMPATNPGRWIVRRVVGNIVFLQYSGPSPVPQSRSIAQLIQDDAKLGSIAGNTSVTSGNFTSLRWRNTGSSTDYEIASFDVDFPGPGVTPALARSVAEYWNTPGETTLYTCVVWTASQPSVGAILNGYVYAPTHPPTDALPLHIGGIEGLHPFELPPLLYTGTYGASTAVRVRYSTAAFARLQADLRYSPSWWRITSPANMADWLDEHLYHPYAVAPVVDSSGRVAPVSVLIPNSTEINVAGLPSITSTRAWTHPTWQHPSRDLVNVVRGSHLTMSYLYPDAHYPLGDYAADRIRATTVSDWVANHDNSTLVGRREVNLKFAYTGLTYWAASTDSIVFSVPMVKSFFDTLAQSWFMKFGDGPIYTDVECSTAVDGTTNGQMLPGKFVKVAITTYPNIGTNARGSTRVMQVLRRVRTPRGVQLGLIDAGPALASPATPGIAVALSSQSSRHAVKVTVSSLSTAARYTLQVGVGATTSSTAPLSYYPAGVGTTAGLVTVVGSLPSKRRVFARVRAEKPNLTPSAWSTAAKVVTASIAAPTITDTTGITAGSMLGRWTQGSTLYGSEVMIDAATGATLGTSNAVARLLPGTTQYRFLGLNSNDSHKWGVRHFDPYGGFSAQDTTTFTTTTGYGSAPAPKGLAIVVGGT